MKRTDTSLRKYRNKDGTFNNSTAWKMYMYDLFNSGEMNKARGNYFKAWVNYQIVVNKKRSLLSNFFSISI